MRRFFALFALVVVGYSAVIVIIFSTWMNRMGEVPSLKFQWRVKRRKEQGLIIDRSIPTDPAEENAHVEAPLLFDMMKDKHADTLST